MASATDRLPTHSRPRRYELELSPDLVGFRFDGAETVTLDVIEATATLTLNAVELDIHEARLETPEGATLAGDVHLDDTAQTMTIDFGEELAVADGYRLHLRFTGTLNDRLHGFYRSIFNDTAGADHVIASTQFEPADARRAFPCWDEPEWKASFAITLVVGEGLTALSNEDITSEELLDDGRRRVVFAETMLLSTYLVAFVVGPFDLTPPEDVDGVPLRLAHVPGKSHLTRFGLEAGIYALRFLSHYFEIPYPAGKIDHIAIPDFAFGAMENLGCVTYRENALLVDPEGASQLELQRVATVIAHETAHMWFGDLVTMRWWNGIWLNEAFATFMELTTTNAFRPEWEVWTAFGTSKAAALATDGLRRTRAVEFPVGCPDEAEAMFDILTYQKGGAVLRMLEQYLGPETFRKGIVHYLTTHAYANTETGDLWDALETISGEPVRTIMDTWIFQGGYPLISVGPGDDDTSVSLSQRRFLYDNDGKQAPARGDGGERWAVPINLRASVGGEVQRQRLLVDGERASVSFDGPVDWVVVNDGAWGFYRTRYSPDLMGRLIDAGLASVCDPPERLSLVADTWAGVVAGTQGLADWVGIVEALGAEDDPDVWSAIAAGCATLDLIGGEEDRSALHAFIGRIAGPAWARLGWAPGPGEPERLGITRARLLSLLGVVAGDPEVRREAGARFERYMSSRSGLSPDLLTPAVHVFAASGSPDAWKSILAEYRAAATPQDKIRYLMALASTSDPVLLGRALDLALGDEVRSQDAPFVVGGVMSNRAGGALAWAWLEEHWDELRDRLPAGLLVRILDSVTALVEPELAAAVHTFIESHDIPQSGPRLEQLIERMDINVALRARLRGTLAGALAR